MGEDSAATRRRDDGKAEAAARGTEAVRPDRKRENGKESSGKGGAEAKRVREGLKDGEARRMPAVARIAGQYEWCTEQSLHKVVNKLR